ncbi:MAG: DUF2949 domain-containing protein [Leptolyngbyaceae cyanobacterium bins.59]|nr:DUF2949 domain-containing protein [Leptolyngbyaceae cyanobacterium bins.59]
MEVTSKARLINFLQSEMAISDAEVAMALRFLDRNAAPPSEQAASLLPLVLWQHGVVTIDQLSRVLDWLETAS